MKTAVCAIALMFLLLAVNGCGYRSPPAEPAADARAGDTEAATPTVAAATVRRVAVLEQTLPVTGSLMAPREGEAAVGAPVAGIVDSLSVRFGQQVVRGQILAHLSTRALAGQIQQAEATIAQNGVQVQQAQAGALQQQAQSRTAILQAQSAVSVAQAALAGAQATLTGNEVAVTNAQQNLTRAQTLFTDGLVARKDVEAAQLALRTAQAQRDVQRQAVESQRQTVRSQVEAVAAARAAALQDVVKRKDVEIAQQQFRNARGALETARAQLSLYTVRAPLSGQVTAVGAGVGEAVDATTKIVTITDLNRLQLQIAIPSASVPQVHVGQPVRFTVDSLPGRAFAAVIHTVGKQVDPTNNTLTAIAPIDNRDRTFQDDMFARVRIVIARHAGALVVPRTALLVTPGENGAKPTTTVLRIDGDGTVHSVAVTTGLSEGDNVEITSGLKPGNRVATTGAYGLEDGAKVTVAETTEAKP